MITVKTRVRQAQNSDIVDLPKNLFDSLMSSRHTNRGGRGISQLTRELTKVKQGFFVVCEDDRKFSHVYTAASEVGIKVTVIKSEKDGQQGVWVIRTA